MWSGRTLKIPALSKLSVCCYDYFKKRQIETLKRQMHDTRKVWFCCGQHSQTHLK